MGKTPSRRPRRATRAQIERLYPNLPKQSQVKTFHAAVGRAIAAWQIVEGSLYEVYRASTGAQRPGAEAAAFFAVPSFRTKLNLTSAAVEFTLYDQTARLEQWNTLRNRAGKKSDRRNQIAHGAVWIPFQEPRTERKIYIGPNLNDPREAMKRKPGQDMEPLTLKRLRGYEKDFRQLAKELYQFARRIPPL